MKKYFFLLSMISMSFLGFSNNINVSNVYLSGQNTTSDFHLINFGISWDNSWKTTIAESNWDAAWVFVKFRLKTQNTWKHATLNTTGHTVPAGASFTTTTDGKGTFINKSMAGIGNNTFTGAQLRWNYGVDGVLDGDSVEVCLFAIEMVCVPQGSFSIGDASTGSSAIDGQLTAAGFLFPVTSENACLLSQYPSGGCTPNPCIYNFNCVGMIAPDDVNGTSSNQIIPLAYPKGYNSFYIMKYEITQEQYVEFLNKLTYTQQVARTAVSPTLTAGTGALNNSNRNGIDILASAFGGTPAVYGCNLNGNTTYNEPADGQNIACNFLNWTDVEAYLDWSALRPMSEFEFEKACRGGNLPNVYSEAAWGGATATYTAATGITNSGLSNEVASNASANCNYNNTAGVQGPMRVGCFAQAATNRNSSGGSYYGIMDLSGNVAERIISVGQAPGRAFTGNNGDGNLDAAGDANTTNWPLNGTFGGTGFRGGNWSSNASSIRITSRINANYYLTSRNNTDGGRGVRIAP